MAFEEGILVGAARQETRSEAPDAALPSILQAREPVETGRPAATVIICAYTASRMPGLHTAVTAVCAQMRDGDELLLVIDHNQEVLEAVTAIRRGEDRPRPAVRVISNQNQRGLSGARNAGIEAARGEIIVFLDDDAVPRADWLARLTDPFADPGVIGAGGVAAPAWEGVAPDWLPEEFLWVVGCSYLGLPQVPAEIRNPIGASMAFRRSTLQATGGFTDGIGRIGGVPLGCEETELSIRATRATGGHIIQQPSALVDHLVTADRMRLRYFVRRCWAEGISKASVSRLTSGAAALESERRYTTRTLPQGVRTGLGAGLRGDPAGFKRAAAIIFGLIITVAGYLRGSLSTRHLRPKPNAN